MSDVQTATNGAGKSPVHVTKSSDWDATAGTLSIKWADEQLSSFNMAELPQEIRNDLMYHGALSRIQQAYVSAKGSPVTAREKASKLWDALKGGEWGLTRGERSYNITVQAFSALTGKSLEEVEKLWDAASKERKLAIGKRPDIRQKIAELRAAEATNTPAGDLASAL